MAASPNFKVYVPKRGYVASCKFASDAAALVAASGEGSTIRYRHRTILWREGAETQPASESFDFVSNLCHARLAGTA